MSHDILLHHLNASRSERLFWALEELGLDYKVKVWQRDSGNQAPVDLKQIHPLGKAPIVVLDGKTMVESAYILTKLQQLKSDSHGPDSDEDLYWSHFAEGSFMLMLQASKVIKTATLQAPFYAKTVVNAFSAGIHDKYLNIRIQQCFDHVEEELGKSKSQWFGGKDEPSLADWMMLYPIHACLANPDRVQAQIGSKTKAWLKAVEARPAYKKGLERQKSEEKSSK